MNEESLLDRRKMIGGVGGLAALGALWSTPVASAALSRAKRAAAGNFAVDVAVIGTGLGIDLEAAIDAAHGDLRGASFFVEGMIYPAGTIPAGAGFNPASATAIGNWLCRGWMIFTPARPDPQMVTHQEFMLGVIGPSNLAPEDQITTSGIEASGGTWVRSVTGGTGRFRHARGEETQHVIGTNTTVLNKIGGHAANFHFSFELE